MRPGLTISCIAHAGVLLWGLVAFSARPNEAPPVEALPVEFVSATQFSKLTAGVKNAPKVLENPKPLADKVGAPKPVKQLAAKVADKPEITTNAAAPPAPQPKPEAKAKSAPEPKKAEAKAKTAPKTEKPKAEAKATPKAEKPKQHELRPDRVARELKKDDSKKPPKKRKKLEFRPDEIARELKRDEQRAQKEKRPAPRFNANEVAALLDKREPRRQVATAATLNGLASIGAPSGHSAHLAQSELDALRAKLISLWNPPAAVSSNPGQYVVTIRIRLTRDYRLDGAPVVLTSGQGPLFEATRDSAVRAVVQAQPYDMLSQSTYDQWKEIDINFDPREVFGG